MVGCQPGEDRQVPRAQPLPLDNRPRIIPGDEVAPVELERFLVTRHGRGSVTCSHPPLGGGHGSIELGDVDGHAGAGVQLVTSGQIEHGMVTVQDTAELLTQTVQEGAQ